MKVRIIIAVVIGATILLYALAMPSIGTILDDFDLSEGYALVALDAIHPGFLARDYFFGSGAFFKSMPKLYVSLFRCLALSTGSILDAEKLLWILCLTVYVPGMYLLIRQVVKNRFAAIVVAWISVGKCYLTVSGGRWGIQPHILPLVMYSAIFPLLLLLAWKCTDWQSEGIGRHLVTGAILGVLAGFSNEINPVSAIGGAELICGFLIFHVLRGRLPLASLVAYVVSLTPGFLVRLLPALQQAHSGAVSTSAVEETLVKVGSEGAMLFPWIARKGLGYGDLFHVQEPKSILVVIAAYSFLTICCIAGMLKFRRSWYGRGSLMVFAILQAIWMQFLAGFSLLPTMLGLYWIWRAMSDDMDRIDWSLLGLWTLSLWIGVIQQVVLLGVWRVTSFLPSILVAYEAARFGAFMYPVSYMILARALLCLTSPISPTLIRYCTIGGLAAAFMMTQPRAVSVKGAILRPPRSAYTPGYLDVADWIRLNTAPGSIVYINDVHAFRALAMRPMTHAKADITRAAYAGIRPDVMLERFQRLSMAVRSPQALTSAAREASASIIALPKSSAYRLDLPIKYENAEYIVYSIP